MNTEAPAMAPKSQVDDADQRLPVTPRPVNSYQRDKDRILVRLRRMEGQVRGIERMVEADQYCVDVLTQLSALIAAARSIGLVLLEDHIRGCVLTADDRDAAVQELTEAIERFTKSVG